MSKKALLMLPISLIVISTASCSWLFKSNRDYTAEQNPSKFLAKTNIGGNYIEYNTYRFNGDIVNKVISKVDDAEYLYTKGTPELSDTTFILNIRYTMFLGYGYHEIAFYENGYATTSRYDRNQEKYLTFYYQFDEEIAKSVCKMVDNEYQAIREEERREQEERDNIEREYNDMINEMTLFSVINKMNEDENVDLEFVFVTDETPARYYDFTFKDDGSICTALKSATFENLPVGFYRHGSETRLYIRGSGWTIDVFREDRLVKAYYSTQDKYGRNYSTSFEKLIDEDSLNIVMNLAYELSAPKNPFGNSSSNPSSSSEEHL